MGVIDKLEEDIFTRKSKYMYEGIPFIGDEQPMVRKNDPEESKPKLNYRPYARTFNMADKDDIAAFETIWNKKMNGMVIIGAEDRHYEPRNRNWLIFMRWAELYYTKD